jgi:mono/diheme cytochrome c family protein
MTIPARKLGGLILALALAILVWQYGGRTSLPPTGSVSTPSDATTGDGARLFAAAGCGNCHTDHAHKGALLAGGRALQTQFGTFYTPNISSDPEFGIGRWSDGDFIRALRRGVSPRGTDYYPSFPYPAFTELTDADILAIKRYIFSLPPQRTADRGHALRFPYSIRTGIKLWKILYLREGPIGANADETKEWNRGAYLVRAVVHCGECHTPRDFLGGLESNRRFAGANMAIDGAKAPDITPDPGAIGRWSVDDLASYLEDGMKPSGDIAGGAMAEVIRGTSALSPQDRHAIAVYIKSQAPIPPAQRHAGSSGG